MANIDMKTAVQVAKSSIVELFADDLPEALALEEIDLTRQKGHNLWAVTLGFYRPKVMQKVPAGALGEIFSGPAQIENRVYKTVYIDADTGKFVKMDMRNV
jgi:hypothetical protein